MCATDELFYEGHINTELNTALSQYTSKLPDGSLPIVDNSMRGIIYLSLTEINGSESMIGYMLNGNYDCPRGIKDTEYTSTGATFTFCSLSLDQI